MPQAAPSKHRVDADFGTIAISVLKARAERRAVRPDDPAPKPLEILRARINEIDESLERLRGMQQQGDALAGRLIMTLERERAAILAGRPAA